MINMKMTGKRAPGRPRTFDVNEALDRAVQVFWTHGYEATSLAMLTAAMGLTPPQIYSAFGDKAGLFGAAVERYLATRAAFASDILTAPLSSRQAIEKLLRSAATLYAAPGLPGGCLLVAGALTASAASETVTRRLRDLRLANQALIAERLEAGRDAGELPADADCAGLARYFAGVIFGMTILARDGATVSELIDFGEKAMGAWPR
jgi:AcrR family transcriptional regulator